MEAIVLAGGKGTRLGELTRQVPKPMLPVGGRPFLEYVLTAAVARGVTRFILSIGYLGEQIREHFGTEWRGVPIVYVQESKPLGTGGAIALAAREVSEERCLILNGDTFFEVNFTQLLAFHTQRGASLTLAMKRMYDFDRYGALQVDGDRVVGFIEKQPTQEGLVNGGVYLAERSLLDWLTPASAFSFETDFLLKMTHETEVYGFEVLGYFLDIGVVADYRKGEIELPGLAV